MLTKLHFGYQVVTFKIGSTVVVTLELDQFFKVHFQQLFVICIMFAPSLKFSRRLGPRNSRLSNIAPLLVINRGFKRVYFSTQPKEILPNNAFYLVTGWKKRPRFSSRDNFWFLVRSKDHTNDLKICRNIFDAEGMFSKRLYHFKIKNKKFQI